MSDESIVAITPIFVNQNGFSVGRHSDERREKALELYKSGLTAQKVAKELGISRATVGGWITKAGISRRKWSQNSDVDGADAGFPITTLDEPTKTWVKQKEDRTTKIKRIIAELMELL